MRAIDELKRLIEDTREELNALVLTGNFEEYYVVSQKLDALIEKYLEATGMVAA